MWLVVENINYNGCFEFIDFNQPISFFITEYTNLVGIVDLKGEEYIITDEFETYEDAFNFVCKFIKLNYEMDCEEIYTVEQILTKTRSYV